MGRTGVVVFPLVDTHHSPIQVLIEVDQVDVLNPQEAPQHNFHRANYDTINAEIRNIQWESELTGIFF